MEQDKRTNERKVTSDYFLIYDRDSGELLGRILDLTTEGAMFMSERSFSVPLKMKCKLEFPRYEGIIKHIFFDAETRWCQYNKRSDWYEIGCQFTKLSENEKNLVEQIIRYWDTKQSKATDQTV